MSVPPKPRPHATLADAVTNAVTMPDRPTPGQALRSMKHLRGRADFPHFRFPDAVLQPAVPQPYTVQTHKPAQQDP